MSYIIGLLILILNLINYEVGLNSMIFLFVSIALYVFLFLFNKGKSFLFRICVALIVSWPSSWINILGTGIEVFHLPFFYVFAFYLIIYILLKYRKNGVLSFKGNKNFLFSCLFLILLSCMIVLRSKDILIALTDFLMLFLYVVVIFVVYGKNATMQEEEINSLKKVFIFVNVICSIGIIFQFLIYYFYRIDVFKIGHSGYFGGSQISCSLLFEDTSCSMIMLGCGALYSLFSVKQDKKNLLYFIIITFGLVFSTRRTPLLILLGILLLYLFFQKKLSMSKIVIMLILPFFLVGVFYFLSLSRPVESFSQFFYNNGRFIDYKSSIELFFKKPVFGIGFGDYYLASFMTGGMIPHNTILRWLNIGGLLFTLPILYLFNYIYNITIKNFKKDEFWILSYCILCSMVIPDILNGRFLLIIFLFNLFKFNQIRKEYDV